MGVFFTANLNILQGPLSGFHWRTTWCQICKVGRNSSSIYTRHPLSNRNVASGSMWVKYIQQHPFQRYQWNKDTVASSYCCSAQNHYHQLSTFCFIHWPINENQNDEGYSVIKSNHSKTYFSKYLNEVAILNLFLK